MKPANTLCGQNADFINVKTSGTYRTTVLERVGREAKSLTSRIFIILAGKIKRFIKHFHFTCLRRLC